jgi:hypothetical protein
MAEKKIYSMKWGMTLVFLSIAGLVILMFALTLEDAKQITISEVLQVSLIVLFLLVGAFTFRRTTICLNEESIELQASMWLARDKKLFFNNVTEVYKTRLFLQTYFVVAGKSENKNTTLQISTQFENWEEILRTLVSKVDVNIVDNQILQYLGIETAMPHEKSKPKYPNIAMPFLHFRWLFRNLVILLFVTLFIAWISDQIDPDRGILIIVIYLVCWSMAFFFMGYLIPIGRWINLVITAAIFLIMSWHFGTRLSWNLFTLILAAMIIGGALSSRFNKYSS